MKKGNQSLNELMLQLPTLSAQQSLKIKGGDDKRPPRPGGNGGGGGTNPNGGLDSF